MSKDWVEDVLGFWFEELEPKQWFQKNDAVDQAIRDRFGGTYQTVRDTKADILTETPRKTLAAIIVLDQFTRNMFRNDPRAFECDPHARDIVRLALDAGHDNALGEDERHFLYMPFMHSEDMADQDRAVALFEALGKEDGIKYAHAHRDIIVRFGRYPHRNAVLGRKSSDEEISWVDEHGGF